MTAPFTDDQLNFLAGVARVVDGAAPKIEAEVAEQADRRLAAAARTRSFELGPIVVSHVPYGTGWRLSRGRWFVAVEVPGRELLLASRRTWDADEAGA